MTIDAHGTAGSSTPEVVLHEERLHVTTERLAVERVVVRRRIVQEVRQVQVSVRREQFEIEHLDLSEAGGDAVPDSDSRAHAPLVIVLREEVPVVQLQVRPYEKVTVHRGQVTEQHQVTQTLSRELADVTTFPAAVPRLGEDQEPGQR